MHVTHLVQHGTFSYSRKTPQVDFWVKFMVKVEMSTLSFIDSFYKKYLLNVSYEPSISPCSGTKARISQTGSPAFWSLHFSEEATHAPENQWVSENSWVATCTTEGKKKGNGTESAWGSYFRSDRQGNPLYGGDIWVKTWMEKTVLRAARREGPSLWRDQQVQRPWGRNKLNVFEEQEDEAAGKQWGEEKRWRNMKK